MLESPAVMLWAKQQCIRQVTEKQNRECPSESQHNSIKTQRTNVWGRCMPWNWYFSQESGKGPGAKETKEEKGSHDHKNCNHRACESRDFILSHMFLKGKHRQMLPETGHITRWERVIREQPAIQTSLHPDFSACSPAHTELQQTTEAMGKRKLTWKGPQVYTVQGNKKGNVKISKRQMRTNPSRGSQKRL